MPAPVVMLSDAVRGEDRDPLRARRREGGVDLRAGLGDHRQAVVVIVERARIGARRQPDIVAVLGRVRAPPAASAKPVEPTSRLRWPAPSSTISTFCRKSLPSDEVISQPIDGVDVGERSHRRTRPCRCRRRRRAGRCPRRRSACRRRRCRTAGRSPSPPREVVAPAIAEGMVVAAAAVERRRIDVAKPPDVADERLVVIGAEHVGRDRGRVDLDRPRARRCR